MIDSILKISKDFTVKYKVNNDFIIFESYNYSRNINFYYNVRFNKSRLLNLKNYPNFIFLYSLVYVYEDILKDIRNNKLLKNSNEFYKREKVLVLSYGSNWLDKVFLLSEYLLLYKNCKIVCNVESYDLNLSNSVTLKYTFRYKSKQYTFLRICNYLDNLSLKEICDLEYNEVLKDLRFSLINNSDKESVLYQKYSDILGIRLADYIRLSLFYNNIN